MYKKQKSEYYVNKFEGNFSLLTLSASIESFKDRKGD